MRIFTRIRSTLNLGILAMHHFQLRSSLVLLGLGTLLGCSSGSNSNNTGAAGNPALGQGGMLGGAGVPVGAGGGTLGVGGTWVGAGGTPVGAGGTPVGAGGTPVGAGGTPVGAGGAPVGAGGAPVGAGGAPVGVGGSIPNGYHEHGDWHGFAFTATDAPKVATITPADFSLVATDGPYCASGNVPVTADYSAIAMIGFNVNQERVANAPKGLWTPAQGSSGLLVNVSNAGNTDVIRVQIQGPAGATDENDRWCAPISQFNQDVIIPWEGFNTKCWDNSGDAYAFQPLESSLVFVPGMGEDDAAPQARPFDMCVNDIGPADVASGTGGSGQTGSCTTNVTGSTTMSGRYDKFFLKEGSRNAYIVQNNGWGPGFQSQTMTVNGTSFAIPSASGSPGSDGAPFSYPSIFIGSNSAGSTDGSNLPIAVGSISSIPTCFTWSGGSGEFNASYDVWFNTSNSPAGNAPTGGYLMLWFHDPANYQPIGQNMATASVGGKTWNIWYGMNGSIPVVSYVHAGDLASYSFDLKTFIDDAQGRGYVQGSWYLTSIFGGFEIWSGGSGLSLDGFSAVVN